jgi:hypothetical protein
MYMWTLTYKVARTQRERVVEDYRRFIEDLQAIYGRMPIAHVIERGRRGTRRLHIHFAVDRWLDFDVVHATWHRGFVWVGDPGKLPHAPGVDRLSKYLAKYVAKQYDDQHTGERDRQKGKNRYGVTQGWQPPEWHRRFETMEAAWAWLVRAYGAPDVSVVYGHPLNQAICGHWFHYPDESLWDPPSPGP